MTLGPRPMLAPKLSVVAYALALLASPATAQQTEAPAAAGLERAQKAADAVFHWIKINADKGERRPAPAPAAAPAPAPRKPAAVAAAPRPAVAPAPAPTPTTERVQALTAPPAPTAAPVTAAAASEPDPELDRRPVLLASAAPTPAPAPVAPQAVAVKAAEPPPPPVEEEEVPLKLLFKVDPAIPRQLQAQNFRNGFAQVQFTVGADGTVTHAQAVKSSHARLATAAVDAVKQWRFAPIGKPRDAAVEVAFRNDVE